MRKLVVVALAVAVVLALFGTVSADPNNQGNVLTDNFNNLVYATDNTPSASYWWATLNTSIPPFRSENQQCAGLTNPTANCIYVVPSGDGGALHFEMQPDAQGFFWLTQLTDVQDSSIYQFNGFDQNGFPTGVQVHDMRWQPDPNHQVTLETMVRFSPNYTATASGTAHGSAGVGFWNMPTYLFPGFPGLAGAAVKAIWFTYTEAGSLGGQYSGYRASIYDQDFPAVALPAQQISLTGVNMSDWFVQRIVWRADQSGNQSVTVSITQGSFYVEWSFTLPRPLPPLSVAMWLDSSRIVQAEDGTIIGQVSPILENQWMEVDYIHIIETGPQ